MNLREGTRRLALFLGVVGIIVGAFASYLFLQSTLDERTRHIRFERLANSDIVQQERKSVGNWVTIDPTSKEPIPWEQKVDKSGIKTIHWNKDNEIESIDTQDGQYLFPTPAPSAWLYMLIAFLPVLGFLIPWGAVRAIGWVGAGFVKGSK